MSSLFALLTPVELSLALLLALIAGTVKGVVGFALPMVLVSGLGTFMAPDLALAGLILPTLVANGMQALRQGPRAAWASMREFRVFLGVGLVFLLASAQMVRLVPMDVLLLMIGIPVTGFALVQLAGVTLRFAARTPRIEAAFGAFAGAIGGFSGIWGPPTVVFLTALGLPKREHIRVQGVVYALGSVALLGAHVGSGVMRAETVPFSLLLVAPAALGMWIGGRLHDRIDQETFRRATLLVLLVAGLNLLRRGLMG
ncbi:MAG: sulfite exporter TauE/SafE family protein [Sedimentitalea sp.]|nr:sulfite exporter TauE/SafE family protein [Sedimentitalea sp.]